MDQILKNPLHVKFPISLIHKNIRRYFYILAIKVIILFIKKFQNNKLFL